jgi:hypothetical protein
MDGCERPERWKEMLSERGHMTCQFVRKVLIKIITPLDLKSSDLRRRNILAISARRIPPSESDSFRRDNYKKFSSHLGA